MPFEMLLNRSLNGALRELLARNQRDTNLEDSGDSIWFAFISSREREFAATRQAIEQCLRKQRFDSFRAEAVEASPIASALVTSGINRIEDVLENAIWLSDLYVLLAGAEYGDPPPWERNISATAWEFDTANARRRRFLLKYPPGTSAILMIIEVPEETVDEHQKQFREKLKHNYYCLFADSVQALGKIETLVPRVRQDLIWTNLCWLFLSGLLLLGSTAWLTYALVNTLRVSLGVWILWASSIVNFTRSAFPSRPTITVS